ncbi:MAG: hypothetical protein ACOC1X_00610 [Promethearchaeota archaeon]
MKKKKEIPDHIEEYFAKTEGSDKAMNSRQIFEADDNNIDLKTELSDKEIALITTLKFNDMILQNKGLKAVFSNYYNKYMRLKVSRERKSREEFVNLNKESTQEDILGKASNLKNLTDPRK